MNPMEYKSFKEFLRPDTGIEYKPLELVALQAEYLASKYCAVLYFENADKEIQYEVIISANNWTKWITLKSTTYAEALREAIKIVDNTQGKG
jgi:hypothetical protein